jgi:uncharacterized protein (TIGR02266 family)
MTEVPEPSDDGDRRSYERVPLETEVSMVSDSQFFAGLSGDVSNGGIFVATYRRLPLGARVSIHFSVPDDGVVVANGTVRWIRESSEDAPPGIGIEFDDLPRESMVDIAAFCERRTPLYHDE